MESHRRTLLPLALVLATAGLAPDVTHAQDAGTINGTVRDATEHDA